jgi:hypothetical protein
MRLFVGALIVLFALVPAVVRATRVADYSGRPTIALSFKKSFDVPPHVMDVPPDLSVAPIFVTSSGIPPRSFAEVNTVSVHAADTLRGPPVAIRS